MKSSSSNKTALANTALPGADGGRLDTVYRANFASVARLCGRILRNPDDAEDAAHEVFLTAIRSLRPDATDAQTRAWLLTVARNHCLDLLRRRKRLGRALATLGADANEDIDLEAAVADRDLVDGVFSQLPARERQALWQSAVERRPIADIADGLRLSYMAAAQVLHRARRHAFEMAARVAVVLGGFQIARALRRLLGGANRVSARAGDSSLDGTLLVAQRLIAAAAVPLILIASQSSSSGATPHRPSSVMVQPAPVTGRPAGNVAGVELAAAAGAGITAVAPSGPGTASVTSGLPAAPLSGSAVGPLADQLRQSAGRQLSNVAGLVSGTLGALPSPLPSVAPNPLPSVIPTAPPSPLATPQIP